MTLETIPRFGQSEVSVVGKHAVVVGASMAGLVAARVLADGFENVTLIERDPLPDEPGYRNGVPQARQPHTLKEAGRSTIEDMFPGYGQDLISAGSLMIDASSDFNYYEEGDFLADGTQHMPMYAASYSLFEHVARQHALALDNVSIRADCRCTEYLIEDQSTTVAGVLVREGDAEREEIRSDLVVDATGRTSRTPTWLEENGYEPPSMEEVHIDQAYSTLLVERPLDDRQAIWASPTSSCARGGGAAPIEGGYWQVTMNGVHGDRPPTNLEEFRNFAASLPFRELEDLLEQHPRASDEISYYPFPSNRRYRYEELDQFPNGLLVIGDAIASYNPTYGQGISVAILEALVLHHVLATGDREDLAPRFFDQIAGIIENAWMMSIGGDFQFEETTGSKPRGTDLAGKYRSRLVRKAHTDGMLRDKLFRVAMMEVPTTTLLRPSVMWRVLQPD